MNLKMENLRHLNRETEAILVSLQKFYLESKCRVSVDAIIETARKYDHKISDSALVKNLNWLVENGYVLPVIFDIVHTESPGTMIDRFFFSNYSPKARPTPAKEDFLKYELTDIGRQAAMYLRVRGDNRDWYEPPTTENSQLFDCFDADLKIGLALEIKSLWTHHSAALVRNSLSLSDIRSLLESDTTRGSAKFSDYFGAAAYAKAVEIIWPTVERKGEISMEMLFKLHSTIMNFSVLAGEPIVGSWKVIPNGRRIAGSTETNGWHDFVPPKLVPIFMNHFMKKINNLIVLQDKTDETCIEKYTDLHLALYAIHPFKSGNLMMAQLLANAPRLSAGLLPIFIYTNAHQKFFDLLDKWCCSKGTPKTPEELFIRNREWIEMRNFIREASRNSEPTMEHFKKIQSYRNTGN